MKKNNLDQQGSALLVTMIIASLLLALIGNYINHKDHINYMVKNVKLETARNELADKIRSIISNQEYIKKSYDDKFLKHSNGNQMLYQCLHGKLVENCISNPEGVSNHHPDKNGYYKKHYPVLILPPIENHPFPDKKQDVNGQTINCPAGDKNHPSCLISGSWDGHSVVGYNLHGESSVLSACYPYEPVIYMNPDCGTNEFGERKKKCILAENIRLSFQMIDRSEQFGLCPIPGRKITRMGSYPKKPEFISLPRHALVDFECNPGATVMGTDLSDGRASTKSEDGNISCQCRFPFSSTGERNQKGVLCEKIADHCPGGTSIVGRKKDGSPLCKFKDEMSPGQHVFLNFGTKNNGDNEIFTENSSKISCDRDGWIQQLNMDCKGEAVTKKESQSLQTCLFFYGMIKLIGGKHFIPDRVPNVFYLGGDEKPCYAEREYPSGGNPYQDWFGALCVQTMFGLLLLEGAGSKQTAKKSIEPYVKRATAKTMAASAAKQGSRQAGSIIGQQAAEEAAKKAIRNASREAVDQLASPALKRAAEEVGQQAAKSALKKGLSKEAAKRMAKEATERHLRIAMKEAAEETAEELGEKAAIKALNESMEEAGKEAAEKVLKEAGEGIASKAMKKKARQAFEKAATEKAIDITTKKVKNAAGKEIAGVATMIGIRQASEEAAERALQKALKKTIRKNLLRKSGKNSLQKAAKQAVKEMTQKKAASAAATSSARSMARKSAKAAGYGGNFANLLFGNLSPALMAATVTLDVAMMAAGMGCKKLTVVPFVGPALWIACAQAAATGFGSIHAKVDISCYPLKQPRISCDLTGTCYHYGKEYSKE